MLELKNICKDYKGFNLKDISFCINEGEYYVLLGRSGSGKSVILEIIAGLIQQDKGSILWKNKDISNEKIQKRKFGLVFQDFAVFPHKNVFSNIAYPLKNKGFTKPEINDTVKKLANEMEILHLLDRNTQTLSGGELQRVALARTLAAEPEILLLDEPLASLDIQLKSEIRKVLRNINKRGKTIIHVTHDYEEALTLSDKIGIIKNGRLIQEGTPYEVFKNPKSKFVANFTGIKNFFKVNIECVENRNYKLAISVKNPDIKFKILLNNKSDKGTVVFRSEDVFISLQKPDTSAQNNFKGIIEEIVRSIDGYEIIANIGLDVSIKITESSFIKYSLKEGKEIWISFKASALKFVEY